MPAVLNFVEYFQLSHLLPRGNVNHTGGFYNLRKAVINTLHCKCYPRTKPLYPWLLRLPCTSFTTRDFFLRYSREDEKE
jgi:hypothetical protein